MKRGTWLALGAMAMSVFVVANDGALLLIAFGFVGAAPESGRSCRGR